MKDMRKIVGGEVVHWSANMAPIRMHQDSWDAIRSGDMVDEWYEELADACWRQARTRAIADLKSNLKARAIIRHAPVDLRPSKLRMLRGVS
jgi:hypothetical protein